VIFVNDVINHEEHKRMYLSRIEEYKKTHDSIMPIGYTAIPSELEKNSKDRVVHSDFHISGKENTNLNFFEELFTNTDMRNLLTKIGGDLHLNQFGEFTWMLESVWFQQYEKNGEHCWHNHPHCHFTNVYFLEMPNEKDKTEVLGLNNKLYSYEAKEGQMITFPGFLQHRSNTITSDRKTIISFNTSYQVPKSMS